MNSGKWNYIAVGVNIMVTFIGAMVHSVLFVALGVLMIAWNWNEAEKRNNDNGTDESDKSDQSEDEE